MCQLNKFWIAQNHSNNQKMARKYAKKQKKIKRPMKKIILTPEKIAGDVTRIMNNQHKASIDYVVFKRWTGKNLQDLNVSHSSIFS